MIVSGGDLNVYLSPHRFVGLGTSPEVSEPTTQSSARSSQPIHSCRKFSPGLVRGYCSHSYTPIDTDILIQISE
jgi:hypothetical protein